jgi:hypothetical protein
MKPFVTAALLAAAALVVGAADFALAHIDGVDSIGATYGFLTIHGTEDMHGTEDRVRL